jgi:hypothetical protein
MSGLRSEAGAVMNSVKAIAVIFGFCLSTAVNATVAFDWAVVGNPGNGGDVQPQGVFGAVNKEFRISKYAVTNIQYAEFLNAIASTDTYELYNPAMSRNANGGITRSGVSGSFQYDVKPGQANNPVTYVSFFDAMRFVNWLGTANQVVSRPAAPPKTVSMQSVIGSQKFEVPRPSSSFRAKTNGTRLRITRIMASPLNTGIIRPGPMLFLTATIPIT